MTVSYGKNKKNFAELYKKTYHSSKLYSSRQIKIATPQYYVFYNGSRKMEEQTELKLSDAFIVPSDGGFEWTAKIININRDKNRRLVESCRPLMEYCEYVSIVKDNLMLGKTAREATEAALKHAIENNFLDGFFQRCRGEIMAMGMTEFDEKEYKETIFEDGRAEGVHDAKLETARLMLVNNIGVEMVVKCTGLTKEEVTALVEDTK